MAPAAWTNALLQISDHIVLQIYLLSRKWDTYLADIFRVFIVFVNIFFFFAPFVVSSITLHLTTFSLIFIRSDYGIFSCNYSTLPVMFSVEAMCRFRISQETFRHAIRKMEV